MSQQLIFFDIDGTLLDDEKHLPSSTKEAIQSLKEDGHLVAFATGRSPFNFKDLREELNIDTYVSFNGQYVVSNNEVIFKNPLNDLALQQLTHFAIKNEHPLIFMNHETWSSNTQSHPYIEEAIQSLRVDHEVIYDPNFYETREIYQTLLFCTHEHQFPYSKFDEFDFIRWHKYSTDVLPTGGSKARGIEVAANHLGVSMENVHAFGDGLNDIEMLKFVHNSVAMGNADDTVKKAAKYVTKDVREDGILHGLQMLGLIK